MIPNKYDFLVVGAGFTGSVLAERIATKLNARVLIIDKRDHIAGNAFDFLDQHGVLIHKYGPHIFHTNAPEVASYLSKFTEWLPYEHRVRALVDDQFVPIPFNFRSMEMIFGYTHGQKLIKTLTDEFGVGSNIPILKLLQSKKREVRQVADIVYEKVFLHYTIKQWGLKPEELAPSVSARVPVRMSWDDRYFQDSFQMMPLKGYSEMFFNMLNNPLIELHLGVSYREIISSICFDRLIWTGPADEFFEYHHGNLPYRSLSFEMVSVGQEALIQGVGQENYPTCAAEHPYTRTTEFRHLTGQDGISFTTRAFEYPQDHIVEINEPYYPIPNNTNRELYRKYATDINKIRSVIFAGRLADYQYYNMDQAVARALKCFSVELCR